MNNSIVPFGPIALQPATDNKNSISHVKKYNEWCQSTGQNLFEPDLRAYRDYLLTTLKPSSVNAHLSHIRASYSQLLNNRDLFYQRIPAQFAGSVSDQKSYVDELTLRIESAIDPKAATVKTVKIQDLADDSHLRLTKQQASDYLNSFGTSTTRQLRDTAMIALMLTTGIRESELASLTVDDLRQSFGGELALRIQHGKGNKARLIPYGQLSWVLVIVDKYLQRADIQTGPVFDVKARQIQNVVKSKPVNVNGELKTPRPHDLRRTYAKLLYLEGMPVKAIADNLGHANIKTTMRYIGTLSANERQPANIYNFDLSKL